MESLSKYLDWHPFRPWDTNKWDEKSVILDTAFHGPDVFFTPLVGHGMTMPPGVGLDNYWEVGGGIFPAHINHNPIGIYQRATTGIYFDIYKRKVYARKRWGAKIQWDEMDTWITRYGNDTDSLISAVLRKMLAANIVGQMENICRDGFFDHIPHKFMYNGEPFSLGTNDFSNLPRGPEGAFDLKVLEDTRLRLMTRTEFLRRAWGTYSQPVPGANFMNSVLVMMTSGTWWYIQNSGMDVEYMQLLSMLSDERIINGGTVQYRGWSTFQDTGSHGMVLHNAGVIDEQVAVTEPINYGDGAPDPATTAVDNLYYVGQSAPVKHYIQCSTLAGNIQPGDFVSIHTQRTSQWGITDGVDWQDGKTVVAEVYDVDTTNNRIILRRPLTEEFKSPTSYTSLGGVAASGTAFAFVTKAQDVHPVIVVGSRGSTQFVRRLHPDKSFVRYHTPSDDNVDFPSINRVTANWYGEVNPWEPDVVEIYFTAAPNANRGATYW